ncbi:MAG: Wzz/FepE/Etk N-terminal domain-containing protein [bacterium]|nr:Wzz/FepE/Etk N-terminal domain-containing protein [bacterium]
MEAPVQSYFTVIRRHWILLAAITLIPTLVAVVLVFFILKPVYEGTTKLIFPLQAASSFMRRSLSEMDMSFVGMSRLLDSSSAVYNHVAILESRTIAVRVYNYIKDEKGIDLAETYPEIMRGRDLTEEERTEKVAELMQKRIGVYDANRGVAMVSYLHTDPALAAEISNAYVEQTLAFLNELNRNTQSDLVTFLEARQVEVEDTLHNVESQIEQFKEETGILAVEEQAKQLISSYSEVESIVAQSEIDYQGSLSMARGMEAAGMDMKGYYDWLAAGENPEANPPAPAIEALGDTAIAALRGQLSDLELTRQQTLLWATANNPEVILLDSQIDSVRRELYREFSDYYDASIANLLVETSAYQAQENVAKGILADLDSRLESFPPDERQLVEMERDRSVQEAIYLVITQELEQAKIQELRNEEPFSILDSALVPTKPVRPRKLVVTFGTFLVAFWFGIAVVFLKKDSQFQKRAGNGA